MSIPTPCHIIDLDKLQNNLSNPIRRIRQKAQCKVLLALKGFSAKAILPYMRDGLDGASASGAFEARLSKEIIGKHTCTFSVSYQPNKIREVTRYSDTIIFNSMTQFSAFHELAKQRGCSCGLRINPEYSELPIDFGANPCLPHSRLGVRLEQIPPISYFDHGKIEGIHLHTMCNQNADTLERTIDALIDKFDEYLRRVKWLNLGGGQMYAQSGYDIDRAILSLLKLHKKYDLEVYVEPCAGILTDCGTYIVTVVDIIRNGMDIAIVNGSGICHMPDAVYRDWRHDVTGAGDVGVYPYIYRLTGPTCYPGDIWGDYSFPCPLRPGDSIVFEDTACYSMVKNNTFNGLPMPALAVYSKSKGLIVQKQYGYKNYINNQ